MKKRLVIIFIFIAVALGAAGVGFALAQRRQSPQAAQTHKTSASEVLLYKDKAVPDALTVKRGETVRFVSRDEASHSLSLGGGQHGLGEGKTNDGHTHQHVGDFSSGEFASDEEWQTTFSQAGTYELHDHLHPGVRVTLVVYVPEG